MSDPLPGRARDGLILALDYGGTKLSAAITTYGAREWIDSARVPSPRDKDAHYDRSTMLGLAHGLLGDRKPGSIGVSFGGPVDAARGVVILSHHVPGWENVRLRDQLQEEFGAPASVDNDANVAALGEYKFGAGRGCASLLYVTVSTGIGGGWVLDGKIFHGADSVAGEIGHTIVQPCEGTETLAILPVCICGRRGCVESLASGPAMARDAHARLAAMPDRASRLRELTKNKPDALTAETIAGAANEGDPFAQEIVDQAARALGFGIGTAITLMNPERVIIGGGVAKSGDRWWGAVRQAARANTLPQMRVDLVPAALGDDATLWGAVALAESVKGQ
jgi:glucokinase